LVGFGNVGSQLARILTFEKDLFPGLSDLEISVVGVTTLTKGGLTNPQGVDLVRALRELDAEGRFSNRNPDFSELSSREAVETLDYEVLVELSTMSLDSVGEPASSYLFEALRRGCHCITANKGPIAFRYSELLACAEANDCALFFESTVMDGAPVFSLYDAGLRGCEILEIEGILNSTTNFVLSRMEEGESLNEAIEVAKETGFAEADPRFDLEGWDASAKICILANVMMGAQMTPFDIEREGISSLDESRVRKVCEQGRHLKLMCRAWRDGNRVDAEVKVRTVTSQSPFGLTSGAASVLRISTDLMGPLIILQEDPTLNDTAYGVLNDFLRLRAEGYF
jgi:homoserine dehydrogenase